MYWIKKWNECTECNEFFCLNIKNGQCYYNHEIENEENKFYYKCNRTNEEGTACGNCVEGYELDKNGLCMVKGNCDEFNEGNICKKCFNYFCLNNYFGCHEINYDNCLECNDISNFNKCTKCYDGYEMNENNQMLKKINIFLSWKII